MAQDLDVLIGAGFPNDLVRRVLAAIERVQAVMVPCARLKVDAGGSLEIQRL